jgi:hypothetical protein
MRDPDHLLARSSDNPNYPCRVRIHHLSTIQTTC